MNEPMILGAKLKCLELACVQAQLENCQDRSPEAIVSMAKQFSDYCLST